MRLLTLNRPEKANAFDERLYHAAANALRAATGDDGVSVVVVTGAGRVFSGGVDLTEMGAAIPPTSPTAPTSTVADDAAASSAAVAPGDDRPSGASRGFDAFVDAISTFPKPLLAAVNGAAVGIGFTMLLHCDAVVVSELARLRAPFTRMGVAPEAASSYLLPRRAGRQRAAVAFFTSDWIGPEDAVERGLAVKVAAPDRLLDDTLELASRMAEHPLPSLMATKRLLLDAEQEGIAHARRLEGAAFAELLRLPNARDRVAAQLDKGTG